MAKWVNQGENRVANILFGSFTVDATLYIGLYEDTSEPAETATLATLTEQSGSGYARIALTRGSWTITADTASYAQVTFTASGGDWGNQYGYFICTVSSGTSGILLCVEDFSDGPYNVTDGDSIKITPNLTVA